MIHPSTREHVAKGGTTPRGGPALHSLVCLSSCCCFSLRRGFLLSLLGIHVSNRGSFDEFLGEFMLPVSVPFDDCSIFVHPLISFHCMVVKGKKTETFYSPHVQGMTNR